MKKDRRKECLGSPRRRRRHAHCHLPQRRRLRRLGRTERNARLLKNRPPCSLPLPRAPTHLHPLSHGIIRRGPIAITEIRQQECGKEGQERLMSSGFALG